MKSENTMNEKSTLESNADHLRETLDMVQEECAEIIQAAAKAKRFGLVDEWDGVTNRQKLETEIGDLLCLISILVENNVLNRNEIDRARYKKFVKMEKWAPNVARYFKEDK